MRHSETVTAGWVLMPPIVAGDVSVTTIPWRVGLTEIQVFGISDDGEAYPVGDRNVFTYR